MFNIGCHLSASKGYLAMGKESVSIGANTFQYFSRNPRGGAAKALDLDDIAAYVTFAAENGIGRALCHAPYTINPCSDKPHLRQFARETMLDDLKRLENIPGALYNFHPGSHMKQGLEIAIPMIIDALNDVMWEGMGTTVLLETMAGKGSEVGRSFDELRAIIDGVDINSNIGVCLDTCHIWEAGYDIVNDLDGVLEEFDKTIGLGRLYAIHLNDSKNPMSAHKDRHEKIGEGSLGLDVISSIINHPKLSHLPFFLETPNDVAGYAEEIKLLKSLRTAE